MASPYPANILRADGEVDLEGSIDFTDPDNQPISAAFTGWTEDVSDPADVASNGGSLDLGAGSLTMDGSGSIDTSGGTIIGGTIQGSHYVPLSVPAITGALSTVADAPAKTVLTSIITALTTLGLVTNGTT